MIIKVTTITTLKDIIESFDLSEELACLNCIGGISASLGIDTSKRCENYYCGQFQLSYTYWADAGKPGSIGGARDFEKCARDRACSEQTIRAYFKKYKKDCDGDGKVDCADMAALHRGGPTQCSSDWIYKTRYWSAFNKSQCMDYKINGVVGDRDYIIDKRAKNESLTSDCLDCICEAVSGCNMNSTNCSGGNICGPFGISQAYWKDGKKPGASWVACAKTKECSGVTMRNYMEKYKRDCNGDGVVTCNDYAAIHRRGPQGCGSKDLQKDPYWHRFLTCRVNIVPNKDTNTVTLDNADRGSDLNSEQQQQQQHSGQQQSNIVVLDSRNEPPSTLSPTSELVLDSVSNNGNNGIRVVPTIIIKQSSDLSVDALVGTVEQTGSPHHQSNQADYEAHKMLMLKEKHNAFQSSMGDQTRFGQPPTTSTGAPYPREVVNPIGQQQQQQQQQQQGSSPSDNKDNKRPIYVILSSVKTSDSPSSLVSLGAATTLSHDANTNYQTTVLPGQQEQVGLSQQQQSATRSNEQQSTTANQTISESLNVSPDQQQPSPPSSPQSSGESSGDSLNDNGNSQSFDHFASSVLTTAALSDSHPPVPTIIVKASDTKASEADDLEWQQKQLQHQQIVITRGGVSKEQQVMSASTGSANRGALNQALAAPPNADHLSSEMDFSNSGALLSDNSTSMLNTPNRIPNECLECICEASSNCDQSVQCISKQRDKNRCGLYMISWEQYRESDIALTSFTTLAPGTTQEQQQALEEKAYFDCTTNRDCAERLIHLYIEKHVRDCNGDGKINCYDVAALHRVGPSQCNSPKFLDSQYWKDFTGCYNGINQMRKR